MQTHITVVCINSGFDLTIVLKKEVEKMDLKESTEIALFKFSLIASLVNNTYTSSSKEKYYRDIASKTHVLPNGKTAYLSSTTIKKWYLVYVKGGYDALIPKSRSDAGVPRVFGKEAIDKIYDIREQFPYITGKLIYQKLVEEGYIKASTTSMSSVLRYIRDNNLKRDQVIGNEVKAFEMEFAGDCWQADTSHGPMIKDNGQKRRAYLVMMIDDASRLIVHGEFFFNDNAVNMQTVFKKSIAKYGVPKRLFVDNGAPYKNDQLSMICASIGVTLIHAAPYSAKSKGKIERSFRTIKDNWINGVDWNDFDSLGTLNIAFNKFLNEKYTNNVHSALDMTPRERYLKDKTKIKFIPSEKLDAHFLHRVTRRVNNDSTIPLNKCIFEVPQKYIGQKINVRYSPTSLQEAYIFNKDNIATDTVYPLKKVDNSKIKRKAIDFTMFKGGENNV